MLGIRKNDKSSNLNRENTFRINLGIRKESFNKLFGGYQNAHHCWRNCRHGF